MNKSVIAKRTTGPRAIIATGHRATAASRTWGPMGLQQLSEAHGGGFLLMGFAGNSAPDHVDQLHSLPVWLRWVR